MATTSPRIIILPPTEQGLPRSTFSDVEIRRRAADALNRPSLVEEARRRAEAREAAERRGSRKPRRPKWRGWYGGSRPKTQHERWEREAMDEARREVVERERAAREALANPTPLSELWARRLERTAGFGEEARAYRRAMLGDVLDESEVLDW